MDIFQLKSIIGELPENEVKSLLLQVLVRIDLLKETDYSDKDFIKDMKRFQEYLTNVENCEPIIDEVRVQKIHIVFSDSVKGTLKQVLKKMNVDGKEKIISFSDIFSIGPIFQLQNEEGLERRLRWLKEIRSYEHNEYEDYVDAFKQSLSEFFSIPEDIPITIWAADNAHEQTALRYVLHLLKGRSNDIYINNTTDSYKDYFSKRNVNYKVKHSGEISDEQFRTIYEKAEVVVLTENEIESFEVEWNRLAESKACLRVWKENTILNVAEDHYDSYIIKLAKKLQRKLGKDSYIHAARLVGEVYGQLEQYVGDEFIEYRVRKLIEQGVFEMQGSLEAMRYYRIKLN